MLKPGEEVVVLVVADAQLSPDGGNNRLALLQWVAP
jgi:hypothetical protein